MLVVAWRKGFGDCLRELQSTVNRSSRRRAARCGKKPALKSKLSVPWVD